MTETWLCGLYVKEGADHPVTITYASSIERSVMRKKRQLSILDHSYFGSGGEHLVTTRNSRCGWSRAHTGQQKFAHLAFFENCR